VDSFQTIVHVINLKRFYDITIDVTVKREVFVTYKTKKLLPMLRLNITCRAALAKLCTESINR